MFNDSIYDCFTFCRVIVTRTVRGTFKVTNFTLFRCEWISCLRKTTHVICIVGMSANNFNRSIAYSMNFPSTLFGNNLTRNHSPFFHVRYCGSLKLFNVQTVVANHNIHSVLFYVIATVNCTNNNGQHSATTIKLNVRTVLMTHVIINSGA